MDAVAALTLEDFGFGSRREKRNVLLPFEFATARRATNRVIVVGRQLVFHLLETPETANGSAVRGSAT
jgi:hypothetical protein